MNSRHWIIAALMRLYPASWRNEFGAELQDLLLARPLTFAIACNVLWSGLRQRGRATEPATIIGLAMAGIVTDAYVFGSELRCSAIGSPAASDVARLDPSTVSSACSSHVGRTHLSTTASAGRDCRRQGDVHRRRAGHAGRTLHVRLPSSARHRAKRLTPWSHRSSRCRTPHLGRRGGQIGRAVSCFRHRFAGGGRVSLSTDRGQ